MPLSGLLSRLRRQPAPAAADPIPRAPAGINYLRAQAGLGPPDAPEPAAPPDSQPPDPVPSDVRSPDGQPSDVQLQDAQSSDVQSPDVQSPDVHSPDGQSSDVQPSDVQPPDPAPPAEPLTCEMFVEQAEQAEKAGDWAAAELIWRAIRTNIPQYWPSYTAGAGALCRLGHRDQARQVLDQGAALFPFERAFPLELGRLAAAQADWPAAETYWRTALAFDVRPWWVYTELAGALEHQDRLEDAEAVLQEARVRADEPDAITLFTYYAQLAGRRGDWAAEAARWAEARRHFPSVMELPDRHHEALMRLAEHDPAAYQAALDDPATTSPDDTRALVLCFESLGGTGPDGGCEFGCFQRAHDAEPLGLFRWAAVPPASLIAALQHRFAGLGAEGSITVAPHDGQWEIRDTIYGTVMHSFVPVSEISAEQIMALALRRMRYLKEKLIADLENPEKIFVLKAAWAPVPAADVEALGQAIRSYGPGELLCVSAADQDHAAGEIMPAAPGVFIGYLNFSGTLDLAARQPEWLALCRTMRGMSVVCNHN